ncbi:UNVERIFIED_ORG: hypothetical protein J2W19_003104 [Shinella zoogloeoides]|nr:hypothetical protein [Shinella zoogloeoides]
MLREIGFWAVMLFFLVCAGIGFVVSIVRLFYAF